MTKKLKQDWIYWISIILSFPLIPLSMEIRAGGIFLYVFIAYLIIWPIAWFIFYIKSKTIRIRKLVLGVFLIMAFPCVFGFSAILLFFREQYEYRRADGTLTRKGLESGLKLIPPTNCNCTYKFINFEMKNDSIRFKMKDSTIKNFKIADVIYVRGVNYSDSQMIEFVLSDKPRPNRLTNKLYYYSDIGTYNELIGKNDYKRLQQKIKSKESGREEKKVIR